MEKPPAADFWAVFMTCKHSNAQKQGIERED